MNDKENNSPPPIHLTAGRLSCLSGQKRNLSAIYAKAQRRAGSGLDRSNGERSLNYGRRLGARKFCTPYKKPVLKASSDEGHNFTVHGVPASSSFVRSQSTAAEIENVSPVAPDLNEFDFTSSGCDSIDNRSADADASVDADLGSANNDSQDDDSDSEWDNDEAQDGVISDDEDGGDFEDSSSVDENEDEVPIKRRKVSLLTISILSVPNEYYLQQL